MSKEKKQTINLTTDLELLDKSELIKKLIALEEENKQLKATIDRLHGKWKLNTVGTPQKPPQKSFDFDKCTKRHILLKFYYLGWDYNGFVVQDSIDDTIEDHIFAALTKSCCIKARESSNYHRCGRTDKGVSSFSQVISIDIRSKLKLDEQHKIKEELSYCKLLNRLLPSNIRCIAWCPVPTSFSARFDCRFRAYRYFFPRGNLNIEAMDQAVKYTVGEHDFRNICKMDVANGVTNYKRTVLNAKVVLYRPNFRKIPAYDIYVMTIKSHAFLWHQIRCLMGILLLVGQEKEQPEIILDLLDIENCPRKPQYNLAHELPLNLWYCEYEANEWYTDKEELKNTVKTLQKDWTMNTIKSVMIENMLSELEGLMDCKDLAFQSDPLLLGVQSKVYQPLMKRNTCDSLETKIEHYENKRKRKE